MRRNILLLILAIVIGFIVAPYVGSWYDKFSPQSSGWITSKEDALRFAGTLVAYVFLVPFLFELFSHQNKRKWTLWLLAPALLFFASGDIKHIYLPIILTLIAWVLSTFLQKIFRIKA